MSKHFGYGSTGSLVAPRAAKISSVPEKLKMIIPSVSGNHLKKTLPVKSSTQNPFDSSILQVNTEIKKRKKISPVNKKRIKLTNSREGGILGFIGSIFTDNDNSSIPATQINNHIDVTIEDNTVFQTSVNTTQTTITQRIINTVSSSTTNTQNVIDLTVNDIYSKKNVNIDLNFNQISKLVNLSDITESFLENITSELTSQIVDNIVSTLNTTQLMNIGASAATSNTSNLIDSLGKIFVGNQIPPGTSINNIVNSDVHSGYRDIRNVVVDKVLKSSNFTNIRTSIITTSQNFLKVNYGIINSIENVSFKMTASQLTDLQATLKSNISLISNIFEQLNATKDFKFGREVKSALEATTKSTAETVNRSEQVSGILSSLTWPVAAAVGGVGLVAVLLVFSGGGVNLTGISKKTDNNNLILNQISKNSNGAVANGTTSSTTVVEINKHDEFGIC